MRERTNCRPYPKNQIVRRWLHYPHLRLSCVAWLFKGELTQCLPPGFLTNKLKKMKKWEYKWDELENYIGVIKHHELMTERSSEGWEMISVVIVKVGSDDRMRFYWKREIL